MNLKSRLNERQYEAVNLTDGYLRIVAGPGSGKTRTLAYRFINLVKNKNINPENILCVTFTNKAAGEMKHKILDFVKELNEEDSSFGSINLSNANIKTFHSFCLKILREDGKQIGLRKNFEICDDGDKRRILRRICKSINFNYDRDDIRLLLSLISQKKDDYAYVYDILNENCNLYLNSDKELLINVIFNLYNLELKKMHFLDFDDLIAYTLVLLKENTNVLLKWQDVFRYIQIDEFQDCDYSQSELAYLLANKNCNLFIVGDPDQAIYEWRGAKPNIFLDFPNRFPNSKTIVLNTNYRSTPEIVNATNELIKNNKYRVIDKEMYAYQTFGLGEFYHAHFMNSHSECTWIANKIINIYEKEIQSNNYSFSYSDIAILYRVNNLADGIESELIKKNIPYIIGGISFFERKEIKDIKAYLRLIYDTSDDLYFLRIVNEPSRYIGDARIRFLKSIVKEKDISFYDALNSNLQHSFMKKTKAFELISLVEQCKKMALDNISVSAILEYILDVTRYEFYLKLDKEDERLKNIKEFRKIVNEFEITEKDKSLFSFLKFIESYEDIYIHSKEKNAVRLLTIHAAKGLEFEHVFMYSTVQGVIPHKYNLESNTLQSIEEERRVMYVALTRAKKYLYVTESSGFDEAAHEKTASQFLFELDIPLRGKTQYRHNLIKSSYEEYSKKLIDDIDGNRNNKNKFSNKYVLKSTYDNLIFLNTSSEENLIDNSFKNNNEEIPTISIDKKYKNRNNAYSTNEEVELIISKKQCEDKKQSIVFDGMEDDLNSKNKNTEILTSNIKCDEDGNYKSSILINSKTINKKNKIKTKQNTLDI